MKHRTFAVAGAALLTAGFLLSAPAEARRHAESAATTTETREVAQTTLTKDLAKTVEPKDTAKETAKDTTKDAAAFHARKVRLTWPAVPSAVRYQVVLLRAQGDAAENVVWSTDQVYTNGVEVNLAPYGAQAEKFYWKVCPLDYSGQAIAKSTPPAPITDGELDPKAPLPTTEFEKMDYAPLYPVFSWVPTMGAKHHVIEVYRVNPDGNQLVRTLQAGEYDYYEEGGYTVPGTYAWRVQAVDESGWPISGWSPLSEFSVTAPARAAPLADSITHGGAPMSTPQG